MNKKGPLNTHIANTMVYIFCTVIAANGGELKEALSRFTFGMMYGSLYLALVS